MTAQATTATIAEQAGENETALWVRGLEYTGAAIASALFMSPAIILNLMSLGERGRAWVFMSIILVAGGAWLVHEARRSFLLALLAFPVIGVSSITAVRNIRGMREAAEERRADATKAKGIADGRRARIETQRKAQADVPGVAETPAAVFSGDIEKEKRKPLWADSKECTAARSSFARVFCDKITGLDVKLKAAEARDDFQRQLNDIDSEPSHGAVVAPPTADNGAIIRVLAFIGIKPTSKSVNQAYEMALVLIFELLAAVMPGVAFSKVKGGRARVSAPVEARAVVEREPSPVPVIELPAVPHVEEPALAAEPEPEAFEVDPEPRPALGRASDRFDELAADGLPAHGEAASSFFVMDRPGFEAFRPLPRDPFPPSPVKRSRNHGGKSSEPRGGNVIQFRAKKPTPDDVKALIASGKSHKEIEELLGISRSTIKRHKKAAS